MTIYYEFNNDFLAHFGVPGMKWGHRKQRINKSTSSFGGLVGTRYGKSSRKSDKTSSSKSDKRKQTAKKALKVGAAVAGTALAAYGGYKLAKAINTKNGQIQQERGKKALDKILEQHKTTSGITKLKNGNYQMMSYGKRGTGVHEGTMKDLQKAQKYINTANEGIKKRANDAYLKEVNKKMNFGQKTANVAKYYVNKRKKK